MNPFTYGRIVSSKNYCGRPQLEAKLKARLRAVQNTYLEGERRKTARKASGTEQLGLRPRQPTAR